MIVVLCSLTCFLPCFFRGIYLHNLYIYKSFFAGESDRRYLPLTKDSRSTRISSTKWQHTSHVLFLWKFFITPTVINVINTQIGYQNGYPEVATFVQNVGKSGFEIRAEYKTSSHLKYIIISWIACSTWPNSRRLLPHITCSLLLFLGSCFFDFRSATNTAEEGGGGAGGGRTKIISNKNNVNL